MKALLTGGILGGIPGSVFAELCPVQDLRHCKPHQNGTECLNMNELD